MKVMMFMLSALLVACGGSNSSSKKMEEAEGPAFVVPAEPLVAPQGAIRPMSSVVAYNVEAVIPPQCYTKHEHQYNPCMTCHQSYSFGSRPNSMNDGDLQREYAFSDVGTTNHWTNLFEDRTERIAEISDQAAVDYINTDNYSTLIAQLEGMSDWSGPIPKIKNLHLGAAAFDEQGFAKDDSQWVAFNYKPLPSTFWPTNGSTDDVMLRLPEKFRSSCNTSLSRDAYIANLAILEMAITDTNTVSIPEVDENGACADLNADGQMSKVTTVRRPTHYVGGAADEEVVSMLYPEGVEFLHTVRYVGVTEQGGIIIPPRMKEVRYMKKTRFFGVPSLSSKYVNEQQEKIDELIPNYNYREDSGTNNGFGWTLWGFIEAEDGHLRLQSSEESLFCMGCHTTLGSTIDQTFSFPRKVAGADGWGYINLKGMKDTPNVGGNEGEILDYLRTVGGGDEFRQNDEMISRWFNADGTVNTAKVLAAKDVYELVTPSVARALALNKAYMTIVKDQDFIHGRDANIGTATNVYQSVDETAPVLPMEKSRRWELRLDWN